MSQKIQSVDRALGLLWLVVEKPGVTLQELAKASGLLPSTALRLLGTLQAHELVAKDERGRYRLGEGAARLAQHARQDDDPVPLVGAEVRALARRVGEQVSLAMLVGRVAVHVLAVDGASQAGQDLVVRSLQYHQDANLNGTALGKVLLAHAPAERAADVIDHLSWEKTAPATITTASELSEHLKMVRDRGYATSIDENRSSVVGIAVPVLDPLGKRVLGLAIHGPVTRLDRGHLLEVLPALQQAAQACTRRLAGT
jgi:DNA-binding IclR family transcriptional regulator